jgi:hypothetical protein
MPTCRVQCRGCKRWFKPSGLSQHLSKTRDPRCRDALAVSRVPRAASSSIQHVAMQPPLRPNRASPVSTGGPSGCEYDHARAGRAQLSDAGIAVSRGPPYLFLQSPSRCLEQGLYYYVTCCCDIAVEALLPQRLSYRAARTAADSLIYKSSRACPLY